MSQLRQRPALQPPADMLFVFLHGLGADGSDLLPLSDTFAEHFPSARFLAPDAPHPWGGTGPGREWFPIRTFAALEVLSGTRKAWPPLRRLLQEQQQTRETKLVLIGFSQGAMLSLYGVAERDLPIHAVVSFAGCLLFATKSKDSVFPPAPALLLHGEDDEVVPPTCLQLSAWNLKRIGHQVKTSSQPQLGHGISQEQLSLATQFLKQNL